jgi:hypothetical protein
MKAAGLGVNPFVVGRSSNLGPDGPQFADGNSQFASDSNAALRQQTQSNDIASSNPRLVKK